MPNNRINSDPKSWRFLSRLSEPLGKEVIDMRKRKCAFSFVVGFAIVLLFFGGVKQAVADSQVERAWENISDQMRTYQVIESLTGKERIRAANKLVFGYEQLRKDVDFFLENVPRNDPRRSAVIVLKQIMEKSRSRK